MLQKYTISDYNAERVTFSQLNNTQRVIIVLEDLKRIRVKNNSVILTEAEMVTILRNKECFADIIKLKINDIKEVKDHLTEKNGFLVEFIK